MEILTGADRRRSWPREVKLSVLAEATGESLAAVARRHDLLPQQVYAWRRAFRREAEQAAGIGEVAGSEAVALVPVEVVAPAAEDAPACSRPPQRRRRVRPIEVTLGNGRRLRADPTIAAEDLRRLIEVLDGA